MLSATFGIDFPKKEAWNRGTGGRSTFWPTGCIIFCWKGRHCLSSWCHHCLQWLPSQRDLHSYHGKVTGAPQNSVSAVNHIR